jgi:hypothetical protein
MDGWLYINTRWGPAVDLVTVHSGYSQYEKESTGIPPALCLSGQNSSYRVFLWRSIIDMV